MQNIQQCCDLQARDHSLGHWTRKDNGLVTTVHQVGSFPKFQAERSKKPTAWKATFTTSMALTVFWNKLPVFGDLPAIWVPSPELEAGTHFPLALLQPSRSHTESVFYLRRRSSRKSSRSQSQRWSRPQQSFMVEAVRFLLESDNSNMAPSRSRIPRDSVKRLMFFTVFFLIGV